MDEIKKSIEEMKITLNNFINDYNTKIKVIEDKLNLLEKINSKLDILINTKEIFNNITDECENKKSIEIEVKKLKENNEEKNQENNIQEIIKLDNKLNIDDIDEKICKEGFEGLNIQIIEDSKNICVF